MFADMQNGYIFAQYLNNKINKMELTEQAISLMVGNQRVLNLLALEYDCTESTIRRWIGKNDPMLTTAASLKIIAAEIGIKQNKLLQDSVIQK